MLQPCSLEYQLGQNQAERVSCAVLLAARLFTSPGALVAPLCRLLNTFQSTLDEVSIIALPPNHSTGTASQAAAQRCVRLQSFYDPAKGVLGTETKHSVLTW